MRLAGDDHEAHGRYAAARFSAAICQCSTVLGTPIVIRSLWLTGAHLLAWLEYRTRGAGEE